MRAFEKHHQLTSHQHVEAVNARWQLRSRVRDIRRDYRESIAPPPLVDDTPDLLPPPAVGDVSVLADALAQFMQDDE